MRNAFLGEIEQSSEELIGENLQFKSADFPFSSIFLDVLIEVGREVIHDDVEILLFSLIGKERIANPQHIRVVESLQNLQLPIFILLVLIDPLDSHQFQRFLIPRLMHNPESTASNLILKCVSVGPVQPAGLLPLPLLPFVEGLRGVLLIVGEDAIGGQALGMRELVLVLGLGVEFGGVGWIFEGDGFDGFLLLQIQGLVLIVYLPILGKGCSGLIHIQTDLFTILVHVRLDATARSRLLLHRRTHLQLQVSNHSLNDQFMIIMQYDRWEIRQQGRHGRTGRSREERRGEGRRRGGHLSSDLPHLW